MKALKPSMPSGAHRIVLDVFRSEVLGGRIEVFLIEALLVEVENHLLIGLRIGRLRRGNGCKRQHVGKREVVAPKGDYAA